jgi:hypothetical protein
MSSPQFKANIAKFERFAAAAQVEAQKARVCYRPSSSTGRIHRSVSLSPERRPLGTAHLSRSPIFSKLSSSRKTSSSRNVTIFIKHNFPEHKEEIP